MELQKTPLHSYHKNLSAQLGPFAGFEMPIQYSSIKNEVLNVRKDAGIFDVSHMGEFIVEGKDSEKFVNYLVTNDILNIGPKKAIYSPLCRDDGTIIDDLIVYKLTNEKTLICVNASNISKDWSHIISKISNFNCKIKNLSDQTALIALQGPQSEKILKRLNILSVQNNLEYYACEEMIWDGHEIIIARTGYTGEDGFELFCNNETSKKLWEMFIEEKITPCGLASRDVLRLEVAYPLYGNELNDRLTPLDCNLKWTVKIRKDSFIGKEALERYAPQFELIKLSLPSPIPRSGFAVENSSGEKIGQITSGTFSPILNTGIAMALIQKDKMPLDKTFIINIREKKYPATFHSKPFLKGGHL